MATIRKIQQEQLWDLYSILNKMGGRADLTSISTVALAKYKQALGKASRVISLIITQEDNRLCRRLTDELDALSRWNFGDRNGNITKEELLVNENIKQAMGGWSPLTE